MTLLQRAGAALRRRQRWLLIALLGVLHLALVTNGNATLGLLCWLVDVGLFILWQPFVYAERQVDFSGLAVIVLVLACGIAWFGEWLLIVWVVILAALVGGRVMFIEHRPTRICYLVAFAYLLSALLFWLVPRVVPDATLIGSSLDREFRWGMPAFFVLMAVLPFSRESDRPGEGMIDLFYSLFIFLLIAVLFLGSLAFMLLRQVAYFEAVLDTLMSMAGLLLLIGWTWNTRPGFTGIDVFFSRYLLSIGLPFENWLHRLTTLASSETDPGRFLSQGLAEMLALPWVDGGNWVADTRSGAFGRESLYRHDFPGRPLQLTLHTRHKLSPALVWHFHLLAQIANEHYIAKQRAREIQQLSYLRAIHETGARLTHDVKNLLQALNNLCFLAQTTPGGDGARLDQLLRRQLPQITQRLEQTLGKLQKPSTETGELSSASYWWRMLHERYADLCVRFVDGERDAEALLPAALFDSVTDNLLQNALLKRQSDPAVEVCVALAADASVLTVCDSGSTVDDAVLADLLRAPVASESGLGVGLYHAARLAESGGYELRLISNAPGKVCFELRRYGV